MAAALRALGDDDVGAAVDGALGVGPRLQLAEQRDAGSLDAARERLGVVEGQEDRLGLAGDDRSRTCGRLRSAQVMKPQPTA